MPDPRAVPEAEVRERLGLSLPDWMVGRVTKVPNNPVSGALLARAGLRWTGTRYLDTEGSQE